MKYALLALFILLTGCSVKEDDDEAYLSLGFMSSYPMDPRPLEVTTISAEIFNSNDSRTAGAPWTMTLAGTQIGSGSIPRLWPGESMTVSSSVVLPAGSHVVTINVIDRGVLRSRSIVLFVTNISYYG